MCVCLLQGPVSDAMAKGELDHMFREKVGRCSQMRNAFHTCVSGAPTLCDSCAHTIFVHAFWLVSRIGQDDCTAKNCVRLLDVSLPQEVDVLSSAA